jgi:hypothetical protein
MAGWLLPPSYSSSPGFSSNHSKDYGTEGELMDRTDAQFIYLLFKELPQIESLNS